MGGQACRVGVRGKELGLGARVEGFWVEFESWGVGV